MAEEKRRLEERERLIRSEASEYVKQLSQKQQQLEQEHTLTQQRAQNVTEQEERLTKEAQHKQRMK